MRNLKKVLALALAMVMALSLMVTGAGAATTFNDDGEISAAYREGVEVLTGLKVFKGKNTTENFAPKDTITRAEVAAIIYRLVTGDVTDKQAGIHADYAKFSDVAADHWAAGYIGYCSNAELIVGDGAGHFNPDTQINGYQALTMILRAVGYDKNGEFKGSGWEVRVASSSRTLGILKNVSEGMLGQPASREMVAELLFQASLIPTVTYTTALGYNRYNSITAAQVEVNENPSLAWNSFKLHKGARENIDNWGRPGCKWNKDTTREANGDVWAYKGGTTIATITEKYLVRYTKAVKECDVWADAGFKDAGGTKDLILYLNGTADGPITEKYRLVATDTTTKVGAQGRITEVYSDRVVMQDVFLAQVTGVTQRQLDKGGHVVIPSYLHLTVYDGIAKYNNNAPLTNAQVTLTNSLADWTQAVGDMLLVNAYTCHLSRANDNAAAHGGTNRTAGVVNISANPLADDGVADAAATEEDKNRAAYESEVVRGTRNIAAVQPPLGTANGVPTAAERIESGKNVFIKGEASSFNGKQTALTFLNGTHTMDGKVYNDALELHLNAAGNTLNTTYAWYFDDVEQADGSYSLIGIGPATGTTKYGIITGIYAVQNVANNGTDGSTSVVANVTYADGTTGQETVSRILAGDNGANTGHAAPNRVLRASTAAGSNTIDLLPLYNSQVAQPMTVTPRGATPSNTQYTGWLHVSPSTAVNAANTANDTHGILTLSNAADPSNLFKFSTTADGQMTAIEVAGHTDVANHANENTGAFEWLYNQDVAADTILYKNLNHLGMVGTDGNPVRFFVNNDTEFLVRSADSGAVTHYKGVSALPGNMTVLNGAEVDWVDESNDDVAEVVYISRARFDTTITYGLLYFNGDADGDYMTTESADAAAWFDGTNYFVRGWLNGEFKQVQIGAGNGITAVQNFNRIKDSVRGGTADWPEAYEAHIFAVRMTEGVVTSLMNVPATGLGLLNATGPSAIGNVAGGAVVDTAAPAHVFNDGLTPERNGNTYSPEPGVTTGVAHFRVITNSAYRTGVYAAGTQNSTLTFRADDPADANADGITVPVDAAGGAFGAPGTSMAFHFTQDTVKYGNPEMLNYNVVDNQPRVSDVTIVYDTANGTITVRELYIDTELAGSTPGTSVSPSTSNNILEYSIRNTAGTITTQGVFVKSNANAYNVLAIAPVNNGRLAAEEIKVALGANDGSIAVDVFATGRVPFVQVSPLYASMTDLLNNTTNVSAYQPIVVNKGQDVYALALDGAGNGMILHIVVS